MIAHSEFCAELRKRLLANRDKVLLRVATGPYFDRPTEFTGEAILQRAESLASSVLESAEIKNGHAVLLLLLPHCAELFLLQLGLVLKGNVPAILAWPTTRVDAEKYQHNLIHQVSHLPADGLVTLPRLAQNLKESLPYVVTGIDVENGAMFEKAIPAGAIRERLENGAFAKGRAWLAEDALFLQFSGGTTGAQKAVIVTAEMLGKQFEQLNKALDFAADDVVISWLPMYHDMGLIACYWMPLWHGASSVQMAANDWVMNPELFLRYIARYRGTLCWLPNFSFSYLSQRREFMRERHELGTVRAWINCSEPVRQKSMTDFATTFADWGVCKKSLQASYAMAEAVFAITQTNLNEELRTMHRNQVSRGADRYAALAFDLVDEVYVSSGKPLSETEIRVVALHGAICGDREAGEIHVRTPSLFSGYWGEQGFHAHTLKDGWHATGDYGFVTAGELYVIGRFKDIVIVGGSNIFPEDVEAVVNSIKGVYAGRVVAFGVEDREYGTQSLAVVAEMRAEYEEKAALALEAEIRKVVLATIGTAPRHVVVVPQRWIVKSTAGKISRRETRERFLREQKVPVNERDGGAT